MEEQDNLDMSLFANADLELNLELDPVDLEGVTGGEDAPTPAPEGADDVIETPEEEITDGDDTPAEVQLSEGDDTPEVVAAEEGAEEEGEEQDDSPNLYSSFATVLSEQGLLPSLDLQDKKVESLDELSEVFKSEIENQAKQYIVNKVGEDGYEALEKGVSLAELQSYEETTATLDSITEDKLRDNVEIAKKIMAIGPAILEKASAREQGLRSGLMTPLEGMSKSQRSWMKVLRG